jgi:hypothetical protein
MVGVVPSYGTKRTLMFLMGVLSALPCTLSISSIPVSCFLETTQGRFGIQGFFRREDWQGVEETRQRALLRAVYLRLLAQLDCIFMQCMQIHTCRLFILNAIYFGHTKQATEEPVWPCVLVIQTVPHQTHQLAALLSSPPTTALSAFRVHFDK